MTKTQFEDRLLEELRQLVADRPAAVPLAAPPARTGRAVRPRLRRSRIVVGSVTAAGVVAGVVLAATWSWSGDVTPAFAVDRQSDGTVTVKINRLSDAQELQTKLRAAGVPAVVHFTTSGKICRAPGEGAVARGVGPVDGAGPGHAAGSVHAAGPGHAAGPIHATGAVTAAPGHPATFSITRDTVHAGQTLLMTVSGDTPGPQTIGIAVVPGTAATCTLKDAPAPPRGASLSTQRTGNVARGWGVSTGKSNGSDGASLKVGP